MLDLAPLSKANFFVSKKYFLIVLVGLLFAQKSISEVVSKVDPFLEDTCPENSRCSKAGAEAFRIWTSTLKNKALKDINDKILKELTHKWGMPINFWSSKMTNEKEQNNLSILTWDSSCPNHQKEGKEIAISTLFLSDFSPRVLKKLEHQGYLTDTAIIKISTKKFVEWKIPRNQTPLYLDHQGGLFISDLEGIYFYYHLSKQSIRISSAAHKLPTISPAITLPCSEDLIKFYQGLPQQEALFTSSFCKSIWDIDAKVYRDVLFTKACL